ncbi:DUF6461 domain-containing protein [Actinokineospora terrae]|uniref:Uncharacterized protein n=1 Tax=Actinokineospora terrae TaxID=155974 RepID=A0A1H9R200_9PSEU|nr:DUF6461 domain-containing protein [Actinokineospora terrae]SER66089.1 hypothetical protein SAMN04487818_104519 [Actinokineospora terrae]
MSEQTYEWFGADYQWLAESGCLTLVKALDEREALLRFGADVATARLMTFQDAAAEVMASGGSAALALAVAVDGGTLVVEYNQFHGEEPAVLIALSAGTTASSVARTINGAGSFTHAHNGSIRTAFPLGHPDRRTGTAPDELLEHLPPPGDEPDPFLTALGLATRTTSVSFNATALQGEFLGAELT